MIESEPRKWTWIYRSLPAPQLQVWAAGRERERQATFIGRWEHDDYREWYEGIMIAAATGDRFYPYCPYWDDVPYSPGNRGGPSFGFAYVERHWTLKEAIVECESYLAREPLDW